MDSPRKLLSREVIRQRIISLEEQIIAHGNAARDAMLEQGDLFNMIAPKGDSNAPNGSGALLEEIARECGIAPDTARNRRDVASQLGPETQLGVEMRRLLTERPDIYLSFKALRTIMADDQPVDLLARLLREATLGDRGRVSVNDVNAARGYFRSGVNTPSSLAERMAKDPEFLHETTEALAQQVKGLPMADRDRISNTIVGAGIGVSDEDRKRNAQGVRRTVSEHEAQEDGPKYLRANLSTAGALMELGGWLDTIVEEFTPDEQGAEVARLIVQSIRHHCDMVEAWAGGHLTPLPQADFDREMEAMLRSQP